MTTRSGRPHDLRRRILTLNVLRLAFSAVAVGLVLFGLFALRETSRSRGWLETDGRVVSSTVHEFAGKVGTTYRPMVIYSYAVGAVRFMSSRVAFHAVNSADREDAARAAARYPAGATVPVFYDPQDPEQAVLERGRNPWVPILTGGAFSMLAVWMRMLRGGFEKRQQRREP